MPNMLLSFLCTHVTAVHQCYCKVTTLVTEIQMQLFSSQQQIFDSKNLIWIDDFLCCP